MFLADLVREFSIRCLLVFNNLSVFFFQSDDIADIVRNVWENVCSSSKSVQGTKLRNCRYNFI